MGQTAVVKHLRSLMKIGKLYTISLICGYMLFVILGIVLIYLNSGVDDSFWRGTVLLMLGGFFYLPVFAISNLTQFILIKKPHKNIIAFFSSILIIGLISIVGIQMNKMDDFMWEIFLPAQLSISFIANIYYQRKIGKQY
jgi:hypothetical protein